MSLALVFLMAAICCSESQRPSNHRHRISRQLPEYLQPPPPQSPQSPGVLLSRPPSSRNHRQPSHGRQTRGQQTQANGQQQQQQQHEASSTLVQRVARWFFDNGNQNGSPPQHIFDSNAQGSAPRPVQSRGPPPQSNYGPPPKPNYGPPPKPNYGPPQNTNYGPPPKPNYGPPQKTNYAPPPKLNYGPPPKSNYGPPPKPNLSPPRGQGPPRSPFNTFGPPNQNNNNFGPPRPYLHSPLRPSFGPPQIPTLNAPKFNVNHQSPKAAHSGSIPGPTSDNGNECNPCNNVPWVPMPSTSSGTGSSQVKHGGDFRNTAQLPLEEFGEAFGSPEFPPFGPPLLPNIAPGPPFNLDASGDRPSNSYGEPIKAVSNQYGPPNEPTRDHSDIRPSYLPNPTLNGQSFHNPGSNQFALNINDQLTQGDGTGDSQSYPTQNVAQHIPSGSGYEGGAPSTLSEIQTAKPIDADQSADGGIEVIKSVNVANFISSIEYPLEIIQSPFIDLTKTADSESQSSQGQIIVGKPILNEYQNRPDDTDESFKNIDTVSGKFDQKQQPDTIHQVVSTSNGKIIKGRPIVLDHPEGVDIETENSLKQNTIQPHSSHDSPNKGTLLFDGKGSEVRANKGHQSEGPVEFSKGTTIFDFSPSGSTQKQGTSLIHNINNLNIFTQQLPPSAPFPNSYHHLQSHISFPSFPHSPPSAPPSSPASVASPGQHSFHHPPPPPPAPVNDVYIRHENAIFNQQAFSVDRPETPVPFLNHPREEDKSNYVTNAPVDTTSWVPVSTSQSVTTSWTSGSSSHQTTIPDSQAVASFESAGMLPPPPPPPRPHQASKKPKQIQVIVPYTSSKQLKQLEFDKDNKPHLDNTGWFPISESEVLATSNQARKVPGIFNCSRILGDLTKTGDPDWQKCVGTSDRHQYNSNVQHNNFEEDYHQHEESRTVTATIAQTPRPLTLHTSPVQHIFAPNIRALLKGDANAESNEYLMLRLQKNIDEWTSLEFSNGNRTQKSKDDVRKGTTSLLHLLVPSKKIPDAYLTTTPSSFDEDNSDNLIATAVPKLKQNSHKGSVKPYFDHEVASSIIHTSKFLPDKNPVETQVKSIEVKEIKLASKANKNETSATRGRWGILEANLIVPAAVTATTVAPNSKDAGTNSATTLKKTWERLQLSISPITNEKVYVVTPMTTWVSETTPVPSTLYTRLSPHKATSRSFNVSYYDSQTTSASPSTVKEEAFPFRNGAVSIKGASAKSLAFHSPRFLIRPQPGIPRHKSVTSTGSSTAFGDAKENRGSGGSPAYQDIATESSTVPTSYPRLATFNNARIQLHHKVVTAPISHTTARRKSWTGYDAIRVRSSTTQAPDISENVLKSLEKILSRPGKVLPSVGDHPREEEDSSVREATNGAGRN